MGTFKENTLRRMTIGRIENFGNGITSIDFSFDGSYLYIANREHELTIFDCNTGRRVGFSKVKKYGVNLIRATHSPKAVLLSSVNDNSVRYLSLHDNRYLRSFARHTNKVINLSMSPIDDMFISCGMDGCFQFWDLNSPECIGVCNVGGNPVASFDNLGLICAVGINSEFIKLYDLRALSNGPFKTFRFPRDIHLEWTSLKFSPDGRTMIINTDGNLFHLIDAFEGMPLQTFKSDFNSNRSLVDVSYTSDSQYIVRGSNISEIEAWSAETGYKITSVCTGLVGPVPCVQFNPRYMLMACGGEKLSLLVPAVDRYSK